MALAALSGDEQLVIFSRLCNPLDPGVAVAFASASSELWTLTQAPRQQLQADHEAAAALGRKAGKWSCKELREAKKVELWCKVLSSDDLALLGTLGSMLPALEELHLGRNKLTQLQGLHHLPKLRILGVASNSSVVKMPILARPQPASAASSGGLCQQRTKLYPRWFAVS